MTDADARHKQRYLGSSCHFSAWSSTLIQFIDTIGLQLAFPIPRKMLLMADHFIVLHFIYDAVPDQCGQQACVVQM